MTWHSIDKPIPEGVRRVLLFWPGRKADKDFPGQYVDVSNDEYVRNGNAKKYGATKWHECPDDPE